MNFFISLFLLSSSLFAQQPNNEFLLNLLKSNNQRLYEQAIEIKKVGQEFKNSKGEVIYCFISGSVDSGYFKKMLFEIAALQSEKDVKFRFVLQGFYSQEYLSKITKISNELDEYQSGEYFKGNISTVISPSTFTKLKINKVPAIAFGTYRGSVYPDVEEIDYMARGDISLMSFFKLISTKDKSFETYSSIISTLY